MNYFISQMRKLTQSAVFRQGGVVLVDQGFLSITNFITGILVARACTKDEYGIYVLLWSLLLIFSSFQRALIQIPFTIYLPRLSGKAQDCYQGSMLFYSLMLSIIFSLVVVLAAKYAPAHLIAVRDDILPFGFLLATLAIPYLLREFIRSALFARLYFSSSLIANFTATIIQLLIIVLLYQEGQLTVTTAFLTILASTILASAIMLWSHRDKMNFKLSNLGTDFKKGWGISKWLLLNVFGMIGTSQAFPWLVLLLIDAEAVAVFGATMAVSSILSPLLRAINAYILPRMSHGFKERNISTLHRMLKKSVMALLIPYGIWTVIGSLYAEQILVLFYSEEYSGYGVIFMLMLLKNLIESISTPLTASLQTLEQPLITTKALFFGSVVTITITPFAAMGFGLYGAASTAVLSSLCVIAYKYIMFNQLISNNTCID